MLIFGKESNLTPAQLRGEEEIQKHEGSTKWKYQPGQSLVWPVLVKHLPTRMYALHKWYMKVVAENQVMLEVRIDDHHYFRGQAIISIPMEEFYFLFQQDALDVSLVSCWIL